MEEMGAERAERSFEEQRNVVAAGTCEWGKGGCFLFPARSEAFRVCVAGGTHEE